MRQWDLRQGDARQVLRTLSEASIQCVVTSPPYWGLRDYSRCECNSEYQRRGEEHPLPEKQGGTILQREADPDCPKCHGTGKDDSLNVVWGKEDCEHRWGEEIENPHRNRRTSVGGHLGADKEGGGRTTAREQTAGSFCSLCPAWRGQLGLEPTPDLYVQHIIAVFREVRRVLRDDGTLWLNMGDCYAGAKVGNTLPEGFQGERVGRPNRVNTRSFSKQVPAGLKTKDLIGMPWRVAFALQADGWWLRSDIIWAKPNPMPESVTDRPTRSHEYIFLLTRKARYFYDADAVREDHAESSEARLAQKSFWTQKGGDKDYSRGTNPNRSARQALENLARRGLTGRNKRTVWEITTQPFPSFATAEADYVDGNGRAYIASPDCLMHGHLAGRRLRRRARHGVQPSHRKNHSQGTDDRPVSELGGALSSKSSMPSGTNGEESIPPRTPENRSASRMPFQSQMHFGDVPISDGGMNRRTNRNEDQAKPPPGNLDSVSRADSPTAKLHSKEIRRTPSATGEDDKHGAETRFHTGDRLPFDDQSGEDDSDNREKSQTPGSRLDIGIDPLEEICLCSLSTYSHFATFPEKLVEPCIKAGTPEKGACSVCGSPWERVVEAKPNPSKADFDPDSREWANTHQRTSNPQSSKSLHRNPGGVYRESTTTGFRPTCDHNAEVEPATVLDPFCGSGTAGVVAIGLGRRFLGIDIKAEYLAMAERRLQKFPVRLDTFAEAV